MEIIFFIFGIALMKVGGIVPVMILVGVWLIYEFILSKAWKDD